MATKIWLVIKTPLLNNKLEHEYETEYETLT